jgi:hypothetical protein
MSTTDIRQSNTEFLRLALPRGMVSEGHAEECPEGRKGFCKKVELCHYPASYEGHLHEEPLGLCYRQLFMEATARVGLFHCHGNHYQDSDWQYIAFQLLFHLHHH